jgi:hypothetical protein
MQVDSQTQSLDEAGPQDRIGSRFAHHVVQSSLAKTVPPGQAPMPISAVAYGRSAPLSKPRDIRTELRITHLVIRVVKRMTACSHFLLPSASPSPDETLDPDIALADEPLEIVRLDGCPLLLQDVEYRRVGRSTQQCEEARKIVGADLRSLFSRATLT